MPIIILHFCEISELIKYLWVSGSTSAAFGNVHICVHINIKPFFAVIFKEIEQNEQSNESVLNNLRFFPILANFIHCQPQRA